MRRQVFLALLVLAMSMGGVCAACDPKISGKPELPEITRGQTVTIQGQCLPDDGAKVFLRTGTEDADDAGIPADAKTEKGPKGQTLTFVAPKTLAQGQRYLVFVKMGAAELQVPGDLKILSDSEAKPKIDPIAHGTVYPSGGSYSFDISGENLGQTARDNTLEIVGRGDLGWGTPDQCKNPDSQTMCPSYAQELEGRRLTVTGFAPAEHENKVSIRVRVGDSVSDPQSLTLAAWPERVIKVAAILVTLTFAAVVLFMVHKGVRLAADDDSRWFVNSIFLDPQTNSYSLSKFQLVAWTTVAVFGFVYVLLARIFVQWSLSFPELPSGWSTLLAVSTGTTIVAAGVTNARGSKGAGPLQPSLADFISSGGVVTGDRFQFFIWTLVGVLGALAMIIAADPATTTTLPTIDTGFLYLMGISSAGYLGGKVVRLPGPVIQQLSASAREPGADGKSILTIRLTGENLSTEAGIKIDGDALRPKDQFRIDKVTAQNAPADPSFYAAVDVVLLDAGAYLEGLHRLTFTNKDAQMTEVEFPVDPLKLDPVGRVAAGQNPTTVNVTGENFADNMTAEWTDAAGATAQVPASDVKRTSDKAAAVTLTPGTAGTAKLVLISASHLRAGVPVQVVEAAANPPAPANPPDPTSPPAPANPPDPASPPDPANPADR